MALANAPSEQKYSSKTTYSLASPFSDPKWSEISPSDQETIRDLLCRLITPIGEHRRKHTDPSQGKRTRKRKRIAERSKGDKEATTLPRPQPPPEPAILHDITVGYNSTHRALQRSSQAHIPVLGTSNESEQGGESRATPRRLAAVFVDRFSQAKIMHNHLPILIVAASLGEQAVTRLAALPTGSEGELSSALNVPRAGMIGIYEDANGAGPLIKVTRDKVPVMDGSWLQGMNTSKYLPVQIDIATAQVPVPPPKSIKKEKAVKNSGTEYTAE